MSQSGAMADEFDFRFSTRQFDTETGLIYYGFRYYSPDLGRWMSRDPLEEAGSLNLYGFCNNNSVNGFDILGLADELSFSAYGYNVLETYKGMGRGAANIGREIVSFFGDILVGGYVSGATLLGADEHATSAAQTLDQWYRGSSLTNSLDVLDTGYFSATGWTAFKAGTAPFVAPFVAAKNMLWDAPSEAWEGRHGQAGEKMGEGLSVAALYALVFTKAKGAPGPWYSNFKGWGTFRNPFGDRTVKAESNACKSNTPTLERPEPIPIVPRMPGTSTKVKTLPEKIAPNPVKPENMHQAIEDFLGSNPKGNIHPRTQAPDPYRLTSADGTRSIRYGPHEMTSSPNMHHYHQETWSYDAVTDTITYENTIVRVPLQ